MTLNKIVVVGGGSAGWMTASLLIKRYPDKQIIVVESPLVATVGVGESTFDAINYYFELLEIDRADFFAYTDASIKLAIEFVDFYNGGESDRFIYPFGTPNTDGTISGLQDWQIKKCLHPDTPNSEYTEWHFPAAHLVRHNTFTDNTGDMKLNFDPILDTALHFDASKFAEWLKDRYALPRGVTCLRATVRSASVNENGIDKLIMDDGTSLSADLFVDCTGFASLLLGTYIREPFISYEDILPNNCAVVSQIPYKNRSLELEATTRCTGLSSGWVWNISLWSRLGAGYVYSDKYLSPEGALAEFKEYLASPKFRIPRSEEEIEHLSFRHIKTRVGIHERTWVKNVVAIGLSAGFIEPLESNGLYTVHEFLYELIRALDRGAVTQWDRDVYNRATKLKFDTFVDFIRLHYALSARTDSAYWLDLSNKNNNIPTVQDSSSPTQLLAHVKTKTFQPPANGGLTWISAGMNYKLFDDISISLSQRQNKVKYAEKYSRSFKTLEERSKIWGKKAKDCPSLEKYLHDTYYKDGSI